MRLLATSVLAPLLLALASACGGAVAQSLDGPADEASTDAGADAIVPNSCEGVACPARVEPAPVNGAPCGTTQGCCAASNASHLGEARGFACGNGAQGTAVCRPSSGGGGGAWAVTSPCPVNGGACGYAGDPSPKAVTSYGTCGEGVNITSPPATNCGGAGAAFEYVPQSDVLATRIELFTTPGVVALLDSDGACDKPGALLFRHDLDGASPAIGWRGADVYPPIALKAQHKYFLHMAPGANGSIACSVSQSGVNVREYTGAPGGRWEGPFSGLAWMGRVVGVCP